MKACKAIFFIVLLVLCATSFAGTESSIVDFYEASGGIGFWGWVGIAIAAIAIAVIAFYTGGAAAAAAPAWMQAVGTWLGGTVYGLSGAAATNAGLAMLGGGAVAAGGLGIKGGVVLLTVLASTSTDIAIQYSAEVAMAKFSTASFAEESKGLNTLPLPINATGSDAYIENLNWIKEQQSKLPQPVLEKGLQGEEMQALLKEASIIMGRDMQATTDAGERVKDLAFLSLLHFQQSRYRDTFKYAQDAVRLAESKKISAGFAQYLYAVSYLYSKNASDNLNVQAKHLIPSVLQAGDSKSVPIVLSVYLDRLFIRIHGGASAPNETKFFETLLKEKKFRGNEVVCIPLMTVRLVQEIKRCQKDIEILAKPGNDQFLRAHDAGSVMELRLSTFIGMTERLEALLPFVEKFEKDFPSDYPFGSRNLKAQIENFHMLRNRLGDAVANTRKRLSASTTEAENVEKCRWWNPFSWWN